MSRSSTGHKPTTRKPPRKTATSKQKPSGTNTNFTALRTSLQSKANRGI